MKIKKLVLNSLLTCMCISTFTNFSLAGKPGDNQGEEQKNENEGKIVISVWKQEGNQDIYIISISRDPIEDKPCFNYYGFNPVINVSSSKDLTFLDGVEISSESRNILNEFSKQKCKHYNLSEYYANLDYKTLKSGKGNPCEHKKEHEECLMICQDIDTKAEKQLFNEVMFQHEKSFFCIN